MARNGDQPVSRHLGIQALLSVVTRSVTGMDKSPKKSATREIVESGVVGAAGMVPIAGSPLAAAFQLAIGWKFGKRQADWLDGLAEAVDDLQRRTDASVTFEDLADNDAFMDAVVTATRAAHATHLEEKLDALRNGVLNTLGLDAPGLDEQARFFRLIEELTPAHLKMLRFFASPARWFEEHGLEKGTYMMGGQATLLEQGIPEFSARRDWYDLLAGDLSRMQLCNPALHVVMSGDGMWSARNTAMGNRFLAFVTDPRS